MNTDLPATLEIDADGTIVSTGTKHLPTLIGRNYITELAPSDDIRNFDLKNFLLTTGPGNFFRDFTQPDGAEIQIFQINKNLAVVVCESGHKSLPHAPPPIPSTDAHTIHEQWEHFNPRFSIQNNALRLTT